MFCSNCGGKIENGVKFCSGCGNAASGGANQSAAPVVQPQQTAAVQPQSITADEKFCFSCGSVNKKAAEICPKCGVNQSKRASTTAIDVYCTSCGKTIKKEAAICPLCGVKQEGGAGSKKWLPALLLLLFTGCGHRFYVGKVGTAIIMLLILIFGYTFSFIGMEDGDEAILMIGGFIFIGYFIWWLIDLISICRRKFTDANGNPLQKDS